MVGFRGVSRGFCILNNISKLRKGKNLSCLMIVDNNISKMEKCGPEFDDEGLLK